MKPTTEQFFSFQELFNFFNVKLFDDKLPNVILNFSRQAGSAGFFAPNHWKRSDGHKTHEISINPNTFSAGKDYIISTLVHEMCHLWQESFGKPGAKGYHNREWADKMIEVGLIPSDTGLEGGKQLGTRMSDYIDEEGRLRDLLNVLPKDLWLPFETIEILSYEQLLDMVNMEDDPTKLEELNNQLEELETAKKKLKLKYSCPDCGVNVWGKVGLNILCGDCNCEFI